MKTLPIVHFVHPYLSNPVHPITVKVLGAGGNGSKLLTLLAELNETLIALGHPGIYVECYDDDIVTSANLARQRFARVQLGMNKAVARINNINGFFGTDWKAFAYKYNKENLARCKQRSTANIIISCVDTVGARNEISELINKNNWCDMDEQRKPMYWIDLGNSRHTGQIIVSTIGHIVQPVSKKFSTESYLPSVVEAYGEILLRSEKTDDTPSCSLREAIAKQDLFINSSLVPFAAELLWKMIRTPYISYRGVFLNLETLKTNPLKISTANVIGVSAA